VRLHLKWLAALASLGVAAAIACGGSVQLGGSTGGVGMGVGAKSVGAGTGSVGMAMGVDEHRRDVEEWYNGRIGRLKKEDGWLTLVGLFPLADGRHRFGSAEDNELVFPKTAPAHAGTVIIENGVARLEAEPGAGLTHDGAPVERTELKSDKDGAEPTEITLGTIRFYVIDRPGSLYLRVKDSASPLRKEFTGIERYPVDTAWRVAAHLERYDPPKKLVVPNVIGFNETVECPGVLKFTIGGKQYSLEPMEESEEDMWIVFGDATNGHETYGGGRFVYIPAPDQNGATAIDFNKSYNPPCVFTPYATCPLPIRQNVLPVRVEAGEKMWGEAH
jgi:uncharacterized protein